MITHFGSTTVLRRHARRPSWPLVIWLGMAGWLALAAGGTPAQAAALRAQDPPSPTFSIVNPLFSGVAAGPVNTDVQVKALPGSGWTPGATITLSAIVESSGTPCSAGSGTPISANTNPITVGGDSSFTATFFWPAALTMNTYILCASESGAGNQVGRSSNTFNVLANTPPAIAVTPLTAHEGDTVQVSGTSWVPIQPISLLLQGYHLTLTQDPGEPLQTASPIYPDNNGNFSVSIKLPTNRYGSQADGNAQDIVAYMGPQIDTDDYALMATSQPLTILPPVRPTPTPKPSPTPTVAASTGTGGMSSGGSSNSSKNTLLIGLLGLIAVVLLLAGIVVAVLALRGRNMEQGLSPSGLRSGPNGGFGGTYGPPGGYGNPYGGGNFGSAPYDQTVAGGYVPQGGVAQWGDDDPWQPPGRPWSNQRAGQYDARTMPPPLQGPFDDEDDDRYRTRMGDPYQTPPPSRPMQGGPPPISRPMNQGGPPPSRPMQGGPMPPGGPMQGGPPPQSRPMGPPRSYPGPDQTWGDDEQNTGPAWPQR